MTANPFLDGVDPALLTDFEMEEQARNGRRGLTITKLNDDEGYWRARLTVRGLTTEVDRKFGSWRVTPENDADGHRDLLPDFCAALQDKVRPIETARRRAAEDAKKPKPKAAPAPPEPAQESVDLMAALEESLKPKTNDLPSGVTLG